MSKSFSFQVCFAHFLRLRTFIFFVMLVYYTASWPDRFQLLGFVASLAFWLLGFSVSFVPCLLGFLVSPVSWLLYEILTFLFLGLVDLLLV